MSQALYRRSNGQTARLFSRLIDSILCQVALRIASARTAEIRKWEHRFEISRMHYRNEIWMDDDNIMMLFEQVRANNFTLPAAIFLTNTSILYQRCSS